MKTVAEINQSYLCMGCGACVAICPMNAISMETRKGQNYPLVDKSKCNQCGKCLNVCPGISMTARTMASGFWPDNRRNLKIGRFRATYIGYSNNARIRFESASGGIATSLILSLIRRKIVDGAILTKMSDSRPLQAESFIARTKKEVISARTSKYCPTYPVAVIKQLKKTGKKEKFAFVGLPCHIHGVRKLQEEEAWIKDKIKITIGLFCSHGLTHWGTDFLINKFAKGLKNVKELRYRGNGWPGGMRVKYEDGKEFRTSLDEYWPPFFAPYFFTPYRCLTCHDFASELADISLGDAWLRELRSKDNKGTSMIVVRSELGERILKTMKQDKEITLIEIPYKKVIESQKGILGRKKIGIGSRIKFIKFLFKHVPQYDQVFKASFKGYIGAVLMYFNSMLSKTKLGRIILKNLPVKYLKRYCGFLYKYAEK